MKSDPSRNKLFPNMAGVGEEDPELADMTLAAELRRARIEVHRLPESLRLRWGGEPQSIVVGQLCGWSFRRAWYYWIAQGPAIPFAEAMELHKTHGQTVRVAGHCGCPSPLEWARGVQVPIGLYHVDNQDGLNALADTIRKIYACVPNLQQQEPFVVTPNHQESNKQPPAEPSVMLVYDPANIIARVSSSPAELRTLAEVLLLRANELERQQAAASAPAVDLHALMEAVREAASEHWNWIELSNRLFAPGTGIVSRVFLTRESRLEFLASPEYAEILRLVWAAQEREKKDGPGPTCG